MTEELIGKIEKLIAEAKEWPYGSMDSEDVIKNLEDLLK